MNLIAKERNRMLESQTVQPIAPQPNPANVITDPALLAEINKVVGQAVGQAIQQANVPNLGQAARDVQKSLMHSRPFLVIAGGITAIVVWELGQYVYYRLTAAE
jgi:hypothetical protein